MNEISRHLLTRISGSMRGMSRALGVLSLAPALLLALAAPAQAEWCNVRFSFSDIDRAGIATSSTTTAPKELTLLLKAPLSSAITGPDTCTNPNIQPWAGGGWLYTKIDALDTAAGDALRRCAALAVLVQNDPDRFDLEVNLGTDIGDLGENLTASNGALWAYRLTFDASSYINCDLLRSGP